MAFKVITFFIFILILGGCHTSTEPPFNEFRSEKILYLSNQNGIFNVFRLDSSGHPVQLTNSQSDVLDIEFSPNGEQIFYVEGVNTHIMDINGQNDYILLNNNAFLQKFLPTGNRIAYSLLDEGQTLAYVINIDGSGNEPLSSSSVRDYCFSNNESITILSEKNIETYKDYLIVQNNLNESRDTLLSSEENIYITNLQLYENDSKIFFELDFEYCTINLDGTNFIKFTSFQKDYSSLFCPETKQLLFVAPSINGNWHIFSSEMDGSNFKDLTPEGYEEITPHFTNDGSNIIFSSTPKNTRRNDIYIMDNNGANRTKITDTPWIEWQPKIY
jgi:TolB protein